MTTLTFRRFDIVRTANVVAVIYAMIFAVLGLVFLLPFALVGGIAGGREGGAGLAVAGLVGGIIFYVVIVAFYAVAGWIFAAIACAAYNFVAGRIGGIRVEVIAEGPSGGFPGFPAGYQPPLNAYPPGYAPTPAPVPNWPAPGAPGAGEVPPGTLPPPPA